MFNQENIINLTIIIFILSQTFLECMGVFDKILKENETLFKNELALDYSFIPPKIQFRENQQNYIAQCIKPLFQKRNGKNLLIYGSPGIGKTVAVKHVLKELSDETEEIFPLYINCWKKNTGHKVILELCELLDIKFIHNLTTEQLIKKVASVINKKSAVICLDEIDKLENEDVLYTLTEDIFRKSLIFITNEKNWISKLDQRIKSRIMPEPLEFNAYSMKETYEILKQRIEYAFFESVFNLELLDAIAEKACEAKDIRTGIYLLKESGLIAEEHASRTITQQHIQEAVKKLDAFKIRNSQDLPEEKKQMLDLVKQHLNKTALELHELSQSKSSYKTFRRKLEDLEKDGLITLEVNHEGPGKSTIVKLSEKRTLNEF